MNCLHSSGLGNVQSFKEKLEEECRQFIGTEADESLPLAPISSEKLGIFDLRYDANLHGLY
jgi:hypothetical protein